MNMEMMVFLIVLLTATTVALAVTIRAGHPYKHTT